MLKGGVSEKVSILGKPMVLSGQFGPTESRSKWSPSIFAHFGYFYGQKQPKNAINGINLAISCPGGSKLVVLSGSRLDLVSIHPGGHVRAFKLFR